MKVRTLRHVSGHATLFGARISLAPFPFFLFYLILVLFLDWNLAIITFMISYGFLSYLTSRNPSLIERGIAFIRFQQKKAYKRSLYYRA